MNVTVTHSNSSCDSNAVSTGFVMPNNPSINMSIMNKLYTPYNDAINNGDLYPNCSALTPATALGSSLTEKVRLLLYMVTPQETFVPSLECTPDVVSQVLPLVLVFMMLEMLILRLKGRKDQVRYIDYVINITCTAIHHSFSELVYSGAELAAYDWLYEHYRVTTLPWNHTGTAILTLISVDYFAYWWHRVSHEVSIVWAAHEFHHNSSNYNLGTAFRLGLIMRFYRWVFYLPTALMGVPVATMWMHAQLGFVFNGLSHVTLIPSLGKVLPGLGHVLEFIFVTPSHHKVHHAVNRYAVDRNYGVVLIVWDRLHGTFVQEKEDQHLLFGTLTPVLSHDIVRLQNEPYLTLWSKVQSMTTKGDKMRALLYGPGWSPGKPRLGLREDIPMAAAHRRPHWEVGLPNWLQGYLAINCFVVFLTYIDVIQRVQDLTIGSKVWMLVFLHLSYTSLGCIYDQKLHGVKLEMIRNLLFLMLQFTEARMIQNTTLATVSVIASVANVSMWLFRRSLSWTIPSVRKK